VEYTTHVHRERDDGNSLMFLPELVPFERLLRPLCHALLTGRLQQHHIFYQMVQSVCESLQPGGIAALRWNDEYPALAAYYEKVASYYSNDTLRALAGEEPIPGETLDLDKQV